MKEKKYSKECVENVVESLGNKDLLYFPKRYQTISCTSFFDSFRVFFSGLSIDKIKKCIGDVDADVENEVLKAEQAFQVRGLYKYRQSCFFSLLWRFEVQLGQEKRGVITIFPTLIINNAQYRGNLFLLIKNHKVWRFF